MSIATTAEDENPVDFTQGFGSFHLLLCEGPNDYDYLSRFSVDSEPSAQFTPWSKHPSDRATRAWHRLLAKSNFPFMKLPPEIRRRIYKCLTEELRGGLDDGLDASFPNTGLRFCVVDKTFDGDRPDRNDLTPMTVEGLPDQRNADPRPGRDSAERVDLFEIYKSIQAGEFDEDDPMLPHSWRQCRADLAPEDSSEEEAESSGAEDSQESNWDSSNEGEEDEGEPAIAYDTQDGAILNPRCTVTVDSRYAMSPTCCHHGRQAHLSKHFGYECQCSFRNPAAFDDLRRLAQVSREVTLELAQALWESAVVQIEYPETFLVFAKERPATLPYIRGIVLDLDCSATVTDTDTAALQSMLEFVSARLDLRSFGANLYVDRNLLRLSHGGTDSSVSEETPVAKKLATWAPVFRALRTENFILKLNSLEERLRSSLVDRRLQEQERLEWEHRREALSDWVVDMWKPDCIRKRESSETAVYLRSREV